MVFPEEGPPVQNQGGDGLGSGCLKELAVAALGAEDLGSHTLITLGHPSCTRLPEGLEDTAKPVSLSSVLPTAGKFFSCSAHHGFPPCLASTLNQWCPESSFLWSVYSQVRALLDDPEVPQSFVALTIDIPG